MRLERASEGTLRKLCRVFLFFFLVPLLIQVTLEGMQTES